LKESIDKFLWTKGDEIWGGFRTKVAISAEEMFAFLYELNTHSEANEHRDKNGNLPRVVRSLEGSRVMHFTKTVHFPPPMKHRLFQNWFTWKKVESAEGMKFVIGFAPLEQYKGPKEVDNYSDDKYVRASTWGLYVIQEIAPLVCTWTRIQSVDVHASLPANILNFQAQKHLGWANRVQERFERNAKVIDKEIRDSLIMKMREGVEVRMDEKRSN